jgi:glycosyltransferase involved in cell wall biosynthesis
MNIWLVNPFDPLPGDPEQEGRYATLVRLLMTRGHKVTWWTSSFSHRFKQPVDQTAIEAACRQIGLDIVFLNSPAYSRNVSLARLWNHYCLARQFARQAANRSDRPEVIVASVPPPGLAQEAGKFARAIEAKFIVDVQDLWPETFLRLLQLAPPSVQPIVRLMLKPMQNTARNAYHLADAIVGVGDGYVDRAVELGGDKSLTRTIPIGIDLQDFDAAAQAGRCDKFTKPENELWLAYTGSLNRSYDCLTIIHAFARLQKNIGTPTRLFVTGRGELADQAEQIIRENELRNVTLTGFLDFPEWAYLLSQCDVGFNASFPEAMIFLPNKIFYYLAAGAAVLNTIPGQCNRIVRDADCGLDYEAGNVEDCTRAMEELIRDRDALIEKGKRSRALAENTYDRRVLYPKYAELIESLAR